VRYATGTGSPESDTCRSAGGPNARVASVGDFVGSFIADVKGIGRCIGALVEPKQKPARSR
jgi:hypothetical protein